MMCRRVGIVVNCLRNSGWFGVGNGREYYPTHAQKAHMDGAPGCCGGMNEKQKQILRSLRSGDR
jgi:hypothetical protein